jgi:uncharacterized membrane protein YfcA
MLAPYLPAFLIAPDIALISSLVLFTNAISTFFYQHSVRYHYSLVIVPSLVMASIVGISKLQGRKRHVIVAVTTIIAVVSGYLWTILPGSRNVYPHSKADNPIANEVRSFAERIPPNAVVPATHSFAPHIENHQKDWDNVKGRFTLLVEGRYSALCVRNDLVDRPARADSRKVSRE